MQDLCKTCVRSRVQYKWEPQLTMRMKVHRIKGNGISHRSLSQRENGVQADRSDDWISRTILGMTEGG